MQTLEAEEGAERDFDKSFGVGMKYEKIERTFFYCPKFYSPIIS